MITVFASSHVFFVFGSGRLVAPVDPFGILNHSDGICRSATSLLNSSLHVHLQFLIDLILYLKNEPKIYLRHMLFSSGLLGLVYMFLNFQIFSLFARLLIIECRLPFGIENQHFTVWPLVFDALTWLQVNNIMSLLLSLWDMKTLHF
jgi:hypothetical protein